MSERPVLRHDFSRGYVQVPSEPTKTMIEAAWEKCAAECTLDDVRDIYKAMLAAAPK